jgi:hypothetical protein
VALIIMQNAPIELPVDILRLIKQQMREMYLATWLDDDDGERRRLFRCVTMAEMVCVDWRRDHTYKFSVPVTKIQRRTKKNLWAPRHQSKIMLWSRIAQKMEWHVTLSDLSFVSAFLDQSSQHGNENVEVRISIRAKRQHTEDDVVDCIRRQPKWNAVGGLKVRVFCRDRYNQDSRVYTAFFDLCPRVDKIWISAYTSDERDVVLYRPDSGCEEPKAKRPKLGLAH